ncbi:MAG: hypothetical protein KAJ66_07125 [Candidatus Omnitrophica bacterium]|nr:hypothetical protein [Candidatus Omnitrophota bacterium]
MEVNLSEITSVVSLPRNDKQQKNLSWTDNLSVQELLDVIASTIADEYIRIAKQNPETFSNNGGLK